MSVERDEYCNALQTCLSFEMKLLWKCSSPFCIHFLWTFVQQFHKCLWKGNKLWGTLWVTLWQLCASSPAQVCPKDGINDLRLCRAATATPPTSNNWHRGCGHWKGDLASYSECLTHPVVVTVHWGYWRPLQFRAFPRHESKFKKGVRRS